MMVPLYETSDKLRRKAEAVEDLLLLALALRAYQGERGRYPDRLEALVPAYLKRVPPDPFGKGGAPIYRPEGSRYVLYSLGPDGKDDGGKPVQDPRQPPNSRRRYMVMPDSTGDIVAGVNTR